MASLFRLKDGKGDQGSNVEAIRINPKSGKVEFKQVKKPIVGWALRVGSVSARSYSSQDWWMTTPIIEILEENKDEHGHYVKFLTRSNSIYEFRY